MSSCSLDIITLNCQGLRSPDNRDTLFALLNCCKPDFLCLQETHSVSTQEFSSWLTDACDAGLLRIPYKCFSSPGTHHSCGVALLYKPRFLLSSCAIDQHGRFVSAQFSCDNTSFQVFNIYGPNKSVDGD